MNSVVVGGEGTEFSYLDSGVPSPEAPYVTIIAIHGMGFTYATFKKVSALALDVNTRFLALSWRGYQGSSPYAKADVVSATMGSDAQKAAFVGARGLEIAELVDILIQRLGLHPISHDGKTGGVGLLGWSAGNTWTLAAIANMDKLSSESQERLKSHIQAHIMHDPPSACLGLPLPSKIWSPIIDQSLPEEARLPFYMGWITSYFDHGDLSSRDSNAINYCVPSLRRAPSIYNMSEQEMKEVIDEGPIGVDSAIMLATTRQSNAVYRKACFDRSVKELLPKMKMTVLVSDATCSFSLNGMFSIQSDNEKENGEIHFEVIPGGNHFIQWDDPEKALKAYLDATML